ncbi:MAG: glycoside hydrolase family 38 C-terminal domain-containing protein [Capsulimonadaceae bacterium]|nr:glycoside hydrolase family 38 C-terminal domain-containing protein [Capsulimonadaceae bacterium]
MIENILPYFSHELREEPNREFQRLWRRVTMELEFARAFANVQTKRRERWLTLIDAAEAHVSQLDPTQGLAAFARSISEAEEVLSEIGAFAKRYRIHNVAHAHIDMNWMWSWPETVSVTHDTFASVLELMRAYPKLTFSQSQTATYALIERYHPAMFEEIRQRVREGRWEITAAQWVEGDKNLASGESLCRHLEMTRSYFDEKFGLAPESIPIDWEPDTFGHPSSLPGILAQGAVKYYYCCRTGGGFEHARIGEARPQLFYWQSPDGSRVLVNRDATWYCKYPDGGQNIALSLVDFVRETSLHDWMYVYGVGNHGGGPTRAGLDYLNELAQWPIYPTLEFSTVKRYFETIEADLAANPIELPVLTDELNFEFTGCYTSQSLIKQANRFGENYLIEAETLSAIASRLLNAAYPHELLRDAWRRVLFCQFHDILQGAGVRQTREYAMAQFQEVGAITGSIKRDALKALIALIDTASLLPATWAGEQERICPPRNASGAGHGLGASRSGLSDAGGNGKRFRPYVVFNPCAWERSERIIVSIFDSEFDRSQIVAVGGDGVARPVLVLHDSPNEYGHARLQVAFDARDVPAMGYKTYLLCERRNLPNALSHADDPPAVIAGNGNTFETPFLKFAVDRELGGVTGLIDKRTGGRITPVSGRSPLGTFQYVVEEPRGMEAWSLGREVAEPVNLKVKGFHVLGRKFHDNTGSVHGAFPTGCQAEHALAVPGTNSAVKLTLSISPHEPRLDFTAEIDWREIGTQQSGIPGLVMTIPLAFKSISARYETPFGSIERDLFDGDEVPSLRYAHIEGVARTETGADVFAGITLVQDSKYGHSIVGNDEDGYVLRLRIVRSSFSPDPTPEVATTTVRYSLYLHDHAADPAALARLGAAWNHPLIALPSGVHDGSWPSAQGFARSLTPGILLTAFKAAGRGNGLVLRLVELNGQDTEASVELSPAMAAGLSKASVVDIMERPVRGDAKWVGNCINVSIAAHQFATVLIEGGETDLSQQEGNRQ